jgi:hypothetical protein
MSAPSAYEHALSTLRSLIWDAPTVPPQVRQALRDPAIHNAVAVTAESNIGIAGLTRLARGGDGQAALAIYVRYLALIVKTASRLVNDTTAIDSGDAHQEGALALLELVADPTVPPTRVEHHAPTVILNRVEALAYSAGRSGISVASWVRKRVRRALLVTGGDPAAAAVWAATVPEAGDRITPETFWSAYSALYACPEELAPEHDVTDDGAAGDIDQAETRILVSQIFNWGILDKREEDILRRTFLYEGNTRETDEQIATAYGVTRARIVQIRKQALAALRTEMEQEGLSPADVF